MGVNNRPEVYEHSTTLLQRWVSYTDNGKRLVLGEVAAGNLVLRTGVEVVTAFNGSGTAVIQVGTAKASDLTEIDFDGFGDHTATSVGVVTSSAFATSTERYNASTPFAVVCDYASQHGDDTAGLALVWAEIAGVQETNK